MKRWKQEYIRRALDGLEDRQRERDTRRREHREKYGEPTQRARQRKYGNATWRQLERTKR